MSPALLNKYLQAAREVADHMVLTPDGFDFAPHPDAGRDGSREVRHPADRRLLRAPAHRLRRLLPGGLALQASRRRSESPTRRWPAIAAEAKVSAEVSADDLADSRGDAEAAKQEVGPVAKLQAMWRALPAPAPRHAERSARKCVEMRDFVVRIRQAHGDAIRGAGGARACRAASQPLLNWKLRAVQLAPPRFRSARPCATTPIRRRWCPRFRRYPGLHQEAASALGRADCRRPAPAIPIWWFRPAERARYEARSRASLPFSRTPSTSRSAAASSPTIRRTRAAC